MITITAVRVIGPVDASHFSRQASACRSFCGKLNKNSLLEHTEDLPDADQPHHHRHDVETAGEAEATRCESWDAGDDVGAHRPERQARECHGGAAHPMGAAQSAGANETEGREREVFRVPKAERPDRKVGPTKVRSTTAIVPAKNDPIAAIREVDPARPC